MQAFIPASHARHAPAWYIADGSVRPCPETPARVDAIAAALRTLAGIQIQGPLPLDPLPAIQSIHSAAYLHYLRTIHPMWFGEFQTDVLPDTFPIHRSAPIPSKPAAQAGHYCFDLAAPIAAGTWSAALESATVAISAATALLAGDPAAYALCRPPGHHAGPDYCGGFCYLNNAAIAAQHLLHSGMKRVAILDVDYHHGNGTQDIFYQRNDVFFVSIHADPDAQYPYFWGRADEIGAGPGIGFTLNFPLPRNAAASAWFAALAAAVARIREHRPEALIISLGVDAHERDTVGDFHLSTVDYTTLAQQLRSLDLPTGLIQEGGYNLEHLGPCVAATLSPFVGTRPT